MFQLEWYSEKNDNLKKYEFCYDEYEELTW